MILSRGDDQHGKVGSRILSDEEWRRVSRAIGLTDRELAVTRALFDNETEFAIGQILGVTHNTVHSHLRRIYGKVGATTRTELVISVFAVFRVSMGC